VKAGEGRLTSRTNNAIDLFKPLAKATCCPGDGFAAQ
jgi:hypothetical protein